MFKPYNFMLRTHSTANCKDTNNIRFNEKKCKNDWFSYRLIAWKVESLEDCLIVWLLDCLSIFHSSIYTIKHSSNSSFSTFNFQFVKHSSNNLLLIFNFHAIDNFSLMFFWVKRLPPRAKVTFYFVRNYVAFPQRSDSVAYLSPAFLSVPSGPGVASFFVLSFFDIFPSFFPLWNGKRWENDRITIEQMTTLDGCINDWILMLEPKAANTAEIS